MGGGRLFEREACLISWPSVEVGAYKQEGTS